MSDFTVGSVVQLKSGGAKMTIQRFIGNASHPLSMTVDERFQIGGFEIGDPICQWFEGSELKAEAFPRESLKEVLP